MASSSSSCSSCPLCTKDPTTVVFRRIADKPSHTVFYTHPSKVKGSPSAEEIIAHYRHRLEEKGVKPWLWVFDGSQFDTDHIMELKTGQGIAELLKGGNLASLVEIRVINPTIHLKVLLKVIQPFMEDALVAKLSVLDDRPRSILEFL